MVWYIIPTQKPILVFLNKKKEKEKSMKVKEDVRKTCKTEVCADDDKIMKASSAAKRSDIYEFFYILKIDSSMTSLKS